jgi:hypothetical protein
MGVPKKKRSHGGSLGVDPLVMEIGSGAFMRCYCLRNVAFPPNADICDDILDEGYEATDLLQLFGSEAEIIRNLKLRFDGLPIHSSVFSVVSSGGITTPY